MRLGILGGTFDPPHNGHLQIAEAALAQLGLDKVLFAPVGVQPLRQSEQHTQPELRARMVELAISGRAHFDLSRADLDRPGPHYSVDLIQIIQRKYPQAALWFIMGEDSLADLLRWRDPGRLIELTRLAVLRRPGFEPDWATLETALPDIRSRLDWIELPEIAISAHTIRERVRAGRSIDQLVPKCVADFVAAHHLYLEA